MHSAVAGCIPVTSQSSIPTAILRSRIAPRTSSFPAARIFRASRSRSRSTSTRRCSLLRSLRKPDDKWGETPCAFVQLKPGENFERRRDHRVLPGSTRAFQGAEDRGVRSIADDRNRKNPEIHAAGAGARVDRWGMPVGLQVIGRQYEDATVLALCYAIEKMSEPRKWPNLA